MFIGLARRGTYTTVFRDVLLAGEGDRPRNLIGDVNGLFRLALGQGDPLKVRRGVAHTGNGANNMLMIATILVIDWDSTYAGVPVSATGRYFY